MVASSVERSQKCPCTLKMLENPKQSNRLNRTPLAVQAQNRAESAVLDTEGLEDGAIVEGSQEAMMILLFMGA